MTRRSKREIERALDDLTEGDEEHSELAVVHEDPTTGEWYDGRGADAERLSEDDLEDADPLVVIQRNEVMERERALEEGREILGPATDAPEGRDVVRVAREEER